MSIHPNPTHVIGISAYKLGGTSVVSMRSLFNRTLKKKMCISGPEETDSVEDFYVAKSSFNGKVAALLDTNVSRTPAGASNDTFSKATDANRAYRKSVLNAANGWLYYVNNVDHGILRIHGWANENPYCRSRRLRRLSGLGPSGAMSPTQIVLANELTDSPKRKTEESPRLGS
jgi:hypothetical protein